MMIILSTIGLKARANPNPNFGHFLMPFYQGFGKNGNKG
jgi:hypothetical protein